VLSQLTSAQLDTYSAAGSVVGVRMVNGVATANATALVVGVCICSSTAGNNVGGLGFSGSNCSTPCRRCSYGTCDATGGCVCFPGYIGADCSTQCNGKGVITWPQFSTTFSAADWDAQYGPNLGGSNTSVGGLFDTSLLYNSSSTDGAGLTLAYCLCTANRYTGPFCNTTCPNAWRVCHQLQRACCLRLQHHRS